MLNEWAPSDSASAMRACTGEQDCAQLHASSSAKVWFLIKMHFAGLVTNQDALCRSGYRRSGTSAGHGNNASSSMDIAPPAPHYNCICVRVSAMTVYIVPRTG